MYTLSLLVTLSLFLKVSFYPWWGILIVALVFGVFALAIGGWATEQPGDMLPARLASRSAIHNLSLAIMLEAVIMIAFCFSSERGNKSGFFLYPGLLFGLVVAGGMIHAFGALTGVDFRAVTWSAALCVFLFVAAGAWLFRFLIKKREPRLELLFICNFLIIIFAIIINGDNL